VRFFRSLFLFVCAMGLLSLAGYGLAGTEFAAPVAIAGFGSLGLALA
jgi:hypothetical protein